MITHRQFIVAAALAALCRRAQAEAAGRNLDFQIGTGFGDASVADIKAVVRSAAESIWKHCPNTRWEVTGFHIYHNAEYPICLDDHRADGRIAIGLTTQGTYWSQFAYQFSHEFCHALAGHSNDWRKLPRGGRKANHWLEESFCETASLFALRAMGKSWQTEPPYSNWKSYAGSLTEYAQERLDKSAVPAGQTFTAWFRENEAAMREKSCLRDKNNIVARQLLPLFEAHPDGWESVTFFNLGLRDREQSLRARLADWTANSPPAQRAFLRDVAAVFAA
jgi:hypothetical protein